MSSQRHSTSRTAAHSRSPTPEAIYDRLARYGWHLGSTLPVPLGARFRSDLYDLQRLETRNVLDGHPHYHSVNQPFGTYPWVREENRPSTPDPIMDQIANQAPHGFGLANGLTSSDPRGLHNDLDLVQLYFDLPNYSNRQFPSTAYGRHHNHELYDPIPDLESEISAMRSTQVEE